MHELLDISDILQSFFVLLLISRLLFVSLLVLVELFLKFPRFLGKLEKSKILWTSLLSFQTSLDEVSYLYVDFNETFVLVSKGLFESVEGGHDSLVFCVLLGREVHRLV